MKDECYEFIKGPNNKINIVGFGSYGEVKLAKNSQTNEMVAIKMIHGRNAKQEIDVHHKLDHPSIIKLINYYYEKEKNTTYMVLQYAESGSLNDKIRFGYGHLPKEKIKKYFRDICKAVQYLHSLKYMHRDIKPQNILLTKNDNAKLCDFGFAAILQYRSTLCGTHQYMAPQMIQQKPYDYKVDVWALGILLFELIQGTAPFRGQTGQDVINEMKKAIIFSNRFEKQQIDLIKKILRVNAENRPSISAILQHPYFKDFKEQEKLKPELETQNSQSRTISSTSYQKQPTPTLNKSKVEPTYDLQKKTATQKQFKHYVPQTKSNFISKNNYTNLPTSPNYTSSYQGFQNNSKYGVSNQPPTTINQNSSTSYRQINTNITNQNPTYQKTNTNTTGFTKSINPVTSPTSINSGAQMRSSGPSNNFQSSNNYVSSNWKRH